MDGIDICRQRAAYLTIILGASTMGQTLRFRAGNRGLKQIHFTSLPGANSLMKETNHEQ